MKTSETAVLSPEAEPVSELPPANGKAAAPPAGSGHDTLDLGWTRMNIRRLQLIQKQVHHGLAVDEEQELLLLQSEMSRRVNAASPLPFDALERLEEYVDRAERHSSRS